MKRKSLLFIGLGVLVVATVITTIVLTAPKDSDPKQAGKAQIVTVAKGTIQVKTTATGKLEPITITTIRPNPNLPSRTITKMLVKNGQSVLPGTVLAVVDGSGLDLDRDGALANWQAQKAKLDGMLAGTKPDSLVQAESALTQAKLDTDQARINVERNKTLFEKGIITQQSWETLQSQLAQSQAKLQSVQSSYDSAKAGTAQAEVQAQKSLVAQAESSYQKAQLILDSTFIRSPVAGVVTEVNQLVGDLASSATAMFTVSDTRTMVLRSFVDEVDVGVVKPAQPVVVTFDGLPDRKYSGVVSQVFEKSTVQSNVTMFTVMIEVPNTDGKLMWGMSATGEILTTDVSDVLVVPTAAIKTAPGRTQIVVMDKDLPVLWDVKTGVTDGVNTQIVAGLTEGDRILNAAPRANVQNNSNQQRPAGQAVPPGAGGGELLRVFR